MHSEKNIKKFLKNVDFDCLQRQCEQKKYKSAIHDSVFTKCHDDFIDRVAEHITAEVGSPSGDTTGSAENPVGVRTRIVLDTSVLVADPGCLHSFPHCDVVIPLTVVEELDGLKSRPDDVGRAARTALRTIEDLRRRARGL